MKDIRSYIYELLTIRVESENDLPFSFAREYMPKSHVFVHYFQEENICYFLEQGIIEVNYSQLNRPHKIIDFFTEGTFFGAYSSLLSNQPSDVEIIGLTDCQVLVLDWDEIRSLYSSSLLMNQIARVATEQLYLKRIEREKSFLMQTAKERYQSLLDNNPELIQQLSSKKIAKYLGIHPESLSRIRASIY
ncbi:MAG: Crp/Fnr family transcriptional regulator [Bacteroidota bacterium]